MIRRGGNVVNIKINVAEHDLAHKHISQQVDFLYAFDGRSQDDIIPTKESYVDLLGNNEDVLIAMNYTSQSTVKSPVGESSVGAKQFTKVTVYKREIWNNEGVEEGESIYHPVAINTDASYIVDYNIANHRTYEYIAYPSVGVQDSTKEIKAAKRYLRTNWGYWSLVELHPSETEDKVFWAEPSDVWLFKYNISTGETTQNLGKTQQNNLTAFPTFSHGPLNNLSGSVTALLGSEMTNYDLAAKKQVLNIQEGGRVPEGDRWLSIVDLSLNGYTERKKNFPQLTSNQRIDMLQQWRNIAFSGNPKLLRDIKGQAFLVQIISSSNTTNQNWTKMPESITFNWVQIGSLEGVRITNKEAQ